MATEQIRDTTLANFIWKNAEDLWGDFKHTDFGKIILPFTLLRRLECVLEPTREAVREAHQQHRDSGLSIDLILKSKTDLPFYNTSRYSLATLGTSKTRQNLEDYVAKFSDNARVIFQQFDFGNTLVRLDKAGLLYKICQNFAEIDLHPDVVPDRVMSNVYEHLIRRFGAEVNEGAEDFMTPRDVVHLATTLLLDPDDALFEANPGLIRTIYDPTCGTGGFLTDAMSHVDSLRRKDAVPPVLIPYGQELEPETHAVALTSMLLRTLATDPSRDLSRNIALGSTLSNDGHAREKFHYGIANPPFGKKWEKDQKEVVREHTEKGFAGRFGPGLPRISDGSMLFLLHLVNKLARIEDGGGRAAIVLSGSPLFNGGAGSGESEIRRWLLENDLVEAIIALPTEIFFRTGIGTYIWLLTNKKPDERKGFVQLINAGELFTPMRKSEGNKRRMISDEQIQDIAREYHAFEPSAASRVMGYQEFGYRRIRVLRPLRMKLKVNAGGLERLEAEKAWAKMKLAEQAIWTAALEAKFGSTHEYAWAEKFAADTALANPELGKVKAAFVKAIRNAFGERDPDGEVVTKPSGEVVPDTDLTDYENVPLSENIRDYFARDVLPHVPDAWVDESFVDERDGQVGKVGYEINFNRHFYKYQPPRPLEQIDAELKQVEAEIRSILDEVTE